MMDPSDNGEAPKMLVEDDFEAYSDRDLLLYIARQLSRLEPILFTLEHPPAMLAAMVPGLGT